MRTSAVALALLALLATTAAQMVEYKAKLSSKNAVGQIVDSYSKGVATLKIMNSTYAVGDFKLTNTIVDAWMAHVHIGNSTTNGPVAVVAFTFTLNGEPQYITGMFHGRFTFDPSVGGLADILAAGDAYFNVHTKKYPAGEIRGQFMPC